MNLVHADAHSPFESSLFGSSVASNMCGRLGEKAL